MAEKTAETVEPKKLFKTMPYEFGALVNPPPDKHFKWISPLALERGEYTEWATYTERHLIEDNKNHGTLLPCPYRKEGSRLMRKLHWLVFIPMEEYLGVKSAEEERERRMKVAFSNSQKGREKVMRGGRVLRDVKHEQTEE